MQENERLEIENNDLNIKLERTESVNTHLQKELNNAEDLEISSKFTTEHHDRNADSSNTKEHLSRFYT